MEAAHPRLQASVSSDKDKWCICLLKISQITSLNLLAVDGEFCSDLVTDPAKFVEDLFVSAGSMGGIIKWPVISSHLTRVGWAYLICVAANGDNNVDFVSQEVVHGLRGVTGNVNSDFCHCFYRKRMYIAGRLRSCTDNDSRVSADGSQESFSLKSEYGF